MRIRPWAAGLASAVVLAGTVILAAPAGAAPLAGHNAMSGYFDSQASGSARDYNSAGGPVSDVSLSTGEYEVTFGGLGAIGLDGGNYQVTPVEDATTCAVAGWSAVAGNLNVDVYCYDFSGAADDSYFTLTVTRATSVSSGVLDYAWVGNPGKSYKLSGKYLLNSAHGASGVAHLGTGRYIVAFAGLAKVSNTGTVKVSPAGAGGGDCQVVKWLGRTDGTAVYVDCFGASGSRQNRDFFVVYARSNNILGRAGLTTANALANKPTTPVYTPGIQYDSHKGARVTALGLAKGEYVPLFAGSEGPWGPSHGGDVQVTTLGSSYKHCIIDGWTQETLPYADVLCYANSGSRVNSGYVVQWLVG